VLLLDPLHRETAVHQHEAWLDQEAAIPVGKHLIHGELAWRRQDGPQELMWQSEFLYLLLREDEEAVVASGDASFYDEQVVEGGTCVRDPRGASPSLGPLPTPRKSIEFSSRVPVLFGAAIVPPAVMSTTWSGEGGWFRNHATNDETLAPSNWRSPGSKGCSRSSVTISVR
jgi:hypothetical protein